MPSHKEYNRTEIFHLRSEIEKKIKGNINEGAIKELLCQVEEGIAILQHPWDYLIVKEETKQRLCSQQVGQIAIGLSILIERFYPEDKIRNELPIGIKALRDYYAHRNLRIEMTECYENKFLFAEWKLYCDESEIKDWEIWMKKHRNNPDEEIKELRRLLSLQDICKELRRLSIEVLTKINNSIEDN